MDHSWGEVLLSEKCSKWNFLLEVLSESSHISHLSWENVFPKGVLIPRVILILRRISISSTKTTFHQTKETYSPNVNCITINGATFQPKILHRGRQNVTSSCHSSRINYEAGGTNAKSTVQNQYKRRAALYICLEIRLTADSFSKIFHISEREWAQNINFGARLSTNQTQFMTIILEPNSYC